MVCDRQRIARKGEPISPGFGKMPNVIKRELKVMMRAILIVAVLVLIVVLPRVILQWRYEQDITDVEQASSRPVAIVFGAGLRRDGRPTAVLADRVATSAQLFHAGKVEKLLMSGSANSHGHNEAYAMRDYARALDVPDDAILLDTAGDRTYLSCLNAYELYDITSALLVTQDFHLPRALVLCDALGIDAQGVSADLREYRAERFWTFRETAATLRALWDASRTLISAFASDAGPRRL
jgi:vancomycin permeability regulator SanA